MYLFVFIEIYFLLLALSWSNEVNAEVDWLALNPGAGNVLISMDKNSVVQKDARIQFWEKVEFALPIEIDEVSGRMIKYKRVQRIMDCAAKTQGVLRGSTFGENNKLIEAIILEPANVMMTPIQTGTIAEQQFNIACLKSSTSEIPAVSLPLALPLNSSSNLRIRTEMDVRPPNQRTP